MKRLVLCRHAKSSWKDMALRDIDRPLNKRGGKDAPMMGKRLADRGLKPDLIISSSAKRALKTARRLAKKAGYPKKNIVIEKDMYGASPELLLARVRRFDNSRAVVVMIGHNPAMTSFANLLGGLDIYNIPTCGIVALDFDVGAWKDVGRKKGKLVFFDYPRKTDNQEAG